MAGRKIAVVGLGGIGGVAAACLSLSPDNDVTVCARSRIDTLTFDHHEDSISIPLKTLTDPSLAEPVDWVILSTKAQDVASAAPWLENLCTQRTTVAVLQNGIAHEERVAPHVKGATVLPAIVYYNGERLAAWHCDTAERGHAGAVDGGQRRQRQNPITKDPAEAGSFCSYTRRLCSSAASMKLANSGCGSSGRLFSSGWY